MLPPSPTLASLNDGQRACASGINPGHADHPKTACLHQPASLPNIIGARATQVAAAGVTGIFQTGHRASATWAAAAGPLSYRRSRSVIPSLAM
jgi:hypothetical protein